MSSEPQRKELDFEKLNRTAFSVGSFDDDDAPAFWKSRTPAERLAAVEFLRQMIYGYDPETARMERTIEILDLNSQ